LATTRREHNCFIGRDQRNLNLADRHADRVLHNLPGNATESGDRGLCALCGQGTISDCGAASNREHSVKNTARIPLGRKQLENGSLTRKVSTLSEPRSGSAGDLPGQDGAKTIDSVYVGFFQPTVASSRNTSYTAYPSVPA
jgi:hypothetical protein